jgi:photosystem II stability/assembly factor-like uncharacterized protein
MSAHPVAVTSACLPLLLLMSTTVGSAQQNVVYDTALYNALEYRMIGPHRGGRVTAVAGIAGQPLTFLMGSTGGGVWITRDAGEDWENISDDAFAVSSIGAIDVAPSDHNVIYVGTGSACIRGNVSTGRGVYRSNDGGKNWSFVGLRDAGQIGDLVVHPQDPDLVYLAALGHPFGPNPMRGVFRSRDGGANWEKVLFVSDSTGAVSLAMNPDNPRILYAGMWRAERKPWTLISGAREGGIYRSVDGGDSWEGLEGGLPQGVIGKTAVAVSPANPDRVWALIEGEGRSGGLYRSDDGGESWRRINGDRRLRQRAWYYTHLHADPLDENTVYVLNTGLLKSVDEGKSFEAIRVPHGDVHALWINPNDPDYMIVGNDGGAQVTLDGGRSWSTMYNQPTAELYSVTVDNEFPYRVYGPQQDNSTITVPSWTGGGVSPEQFWYSVGGCESGPVALHPDHPNIIYSGCYGGTIDRVNVETGQERNVLIYPQLQLGQAPRDLKYRFQWNAPIVVSPHDPNVVYHGSQYVLRTTDGGQTWETISPDLTTNTAAHQDYAGEPITKDNTGIEVFNTVFTIVVSPHDANTLWVGTDDGRVHITRDGGGSWTEITPSGLPRFGTVDAIEVSPHQPGRAYIAVHAYRLDDYSPYIFKTNDYGASWQRLTDGRNGIPADYPVRVVREDPDRQGLLYAGTEFGLFVSFDDGAHWQSLQLNLPVTPVMDLAVHHQDLVVATQGRSFWILDDLTPLHQIDREMASEAVWLFDPRDPYRVDIGGGFGEDWPEYPREGAWIFYNLREPLPDEITLEILDGDGEVVQTFTSDSAKAREEDTPALPAEAGMNRFVWNLRYPAVDEVDDAVVWGFTGGPLAMPGKYSARVTAGETSQTREFEVLADPRREDVTAEAYQAQFEMAVAIRDTLNSVYDAIRTIRSVREQAKSTVSHAVEAGQEEDLKAQADSIAAKLTDIEQGLMQTKNESRQDPLNFPPRLDNQFAYLYGYVAGPNDQPTEGAHTRFQDLNQEWSELRDRLDTVLRTDVAALNQLLQERGVDNIIIPRQGEPQRAGS